MNDEEKDILIKIANNAFRIRKAVDTIKRCVQFFLVVWIIIQILAVLLEVLGWVM